MVRRRVRKGQFFLISAISIVLILYGLSDFLKIQSFDSTVVQANTLPQIAMSIEYDLNRTLVSSPPAAAENNLDEYIGIQKSSLKAIGYILDVKYNITSTPKTARILITYPGMYYDKLFYLG